MYTSQQALHYPRSLAGLLLSLCLLLIGGCQSENSTSTAADLRITATSIADGASQVGTTPDISFTFSEPLDTATVNIASFILSDANGLPVSGNITLNADRTVATFVPDTPLAGKGLYVATLTTAIRATNGNRLAADYSLVFNTGAWTVQAGTTGDESIESMTADQGNIYLAGQTTGSPDGTANTGGKDALIVVYGINGMRSRTHLLGTGADDIAHAVAVDGQSNLYVAGETAGALEPGITAQGRDLFLAKFDREGNHLWTRQYGSPGDDVALDMALDGNDNVYLAGKTNGSLDGTTTASGDDGFLIKLDADGNPLWTRQIASTAGTETAQAVAIDANGQACVTGSTTGDLDGNAASGLNDIFLACYDTNGTRLWLSMIRRLPNGITTELSAENARAITIDGTGNLYIAGDRLDPFDPKNGIEMLIAKFDASGNSVWVEIPVNAGNDLANDLLLDDQGNLYVAGQSDGTFAGQSSAGADDIILMKYGSDGTQQWIHQSGSAGFDVPLAMTRTADGLILVGGQTDGALDGNTVIGGTDLFIRLYAPDGSLR